MQLIIFLDSAYLATSELPVWIVINKAQLAQCGDPPPVLPSIRYIELDSITVSTHFLSTQSVQHATDTRSWCAV
ncbi:hypothetical protein DPMN_137022 [Dreissena polymorpha]|uniref:Uncharacterized protein n=1 Tax=Dreissena polymorpha TaxID=45954 RepID=A0A9D4G4Y2_DREPO|nr:hypothetical protein DPMN_137022 [Dreissena polymorpha]